MNRRHALLTLAGLGAVAARESSAEPTPVIGLLDAGERLEWWAAFRQQLRDLGHVEGQNVAFEPRFASGKFEQLPVLAHELVRLKVSVIVTGGSVAAQAAQRATGTIPIVMATGDDPVKVGLVASLARPGGNVTGVTSIALGLTGKRFELLAEAIPALSRLAVLWHRDNPTSELTLSELEATVRSSKVGLQILGATTANEITAAFAAMTQERAGAVFVVTDPRFFSDRRRISDLALKHRLPSVYGVAEYVEAGGLLSYGPLYAGLFRNAAVYVDKILKGARPGDLPIQQPTTFETVVNLKTARALGVSVPRQILSRADRVIE